MTRFLLAILLLTGLIGSGMAAPPIPPVLVSKDIYRQPDPLPGTVVTLDSATSTTFSLYIPSDTLYEADGATTLTVHFHGAAWFVQQEHVRRGARHPLLVANAKEGDAVYENEITRPGLLDGLLRQVASGMSASGGPANARVGSLELSGFSAGYAGVRGILRQPGYESMVRRVVLNDSVYVGDAPDSERPNNRKPRRGADGIDPFVTFARKAMAGERTFLMEFSSTPSMKSVGPMDCARAIIADLGVPIREVPLNSIPAARSAADYRLGWRADAGNAHFWCYLAEERPIHLAHLRNQADMWRALDGLTSAGAVPPPMPIRPIRPSEDPMPGDLITLDIGTTGTVTLFVPTVYKVPEDGGVEVTLHFHGTTWFVIREHLRRGMSEPLVVLELGQGSTVYKVPFESQERFPLLLQAVERELKARGGPDSTRIGTVNITSFSAGYGAVREIIKSPANVALIKRIVLGDSSYGGLDEQALKEERRVVVPEHVEPWANFARHAMKGEKTLLMVTSEITPETYAGTHEVARAVTEALKASIIETNAAQPEPGAPFPYPLATQADLGSFHWWGYKGADAQIHMTLARHIGDAWMALDQCGDP